MTAIPPRLPRDTKALQDMAQDSGQYAKYMTYRTNSSDYGAHTLPSAGSQAGISPRAQCLHNRRTIQEMTARFTTDHSWSQLGGTVPRKHTTITLPPNAKPGAKMNVEVRERVREETPPRPTGIRERRRVCGAPSLVEAARRSRTLRPMSPLCALSVISVGVMRRAGTDLCVTFACDAWLRVVARRGRALAKSRVHGS